ncbi:phosphoinositide 3-kinase regulatory subunit 6 isoform X2 [Cyclopterus lumpus]|uniref:Phosphoinositide-3-kinase, regulatory subunit 6b n=1 Tax=Cyclopterus lumpus TaxID=8103 RepID=A0A8C2ZZT4_CYCLU|nr:phosphoinositide 3-kinase regulatory subunit 6 isoform X2 [Cyclopterus lumpus]
MVDPTTRVAFSTVESSLNNMVQALLKEMSDQSVWEKGLIRWSLQKKLEANPSCSVSLIRVLVKELDKLLQIDKARSYTHTIPVLHTLYYVVMQSGVMIPTSVYQTVYECMMKLLILPSPYSGVALSTLRSIKMEMTTPGSLYHRRVTAEQNLKNEHLTLQEKVFVLADPAVFSAPMEAAVRTHLEASSFLTDVSTRQKNVVLHVLQTGLGTTCQSSKLTQALEALGEHMVETYFQEVALAVEKSLKHGAGGCANYLTRLQHIYRDIFTASQEERTKLHQGPVFSTAMPYPEINFLLWRDEEELWSLLANLAKCCGSNSTTVDEEDSVQSEDSGIERDLQESDTSTNPTATFTRRSAFKTIKTAHERGLMSEKRDAFPGGSPLSKEDRRRHTARVVVLGDDRVLGRLSRAYHSIRERESKHLILTRKLNLRLYYIPVTDVAPSQSSPDSPCENEGRLGLASFLGNVDLWYNSNINSLGAAISKLARKSVHREPAEPDVFLLDTLCYYLRCGTQTVNLPLYSVKMTRSSCDVVEEVFVSHLEADIPEFRHLKEKFSKEPSVCRKKPLVEVFHSLISVNYTEISLSKREVVKREAPMAFGVAITSEPAASTSGEDHLTVQFHSVNPGNNTTIQIQNISIRALQHRTLSVCLDKDSRSTYTDVQRVEISPCLHPGCGIGSRSTRELLFSKYLDKAMHLPISTFTGEPCASWCTDNAYCT